MTLNIKEHIKDVICKIPKKESQLRHLNVFIMYYMCRLERMDWQGQGELLKQQTLTALSDRDQQLRQLTAMLEEARASKQRHEYTQRQVKAIPIS